ncbi:hypothetical protein MUK42_33569 [Musa troglodytarum]|uniref:RRM domain-containing protein n=1 Tax=Musa troglodytarum TaxID=320322 RepID=A0A9E7L5H8_9LILI|nr:hypothetical protein MUK42_33569 [Musa troglodytarum]
MEDSKKRKLEEEDGSGGAFAFEFSKQLRFLLDPSERISSSISLGNQYPSVAEEIKGLASEDPVHRKLLFVACLGRLLQKLCVLVHGEIEEGAVIVDKATGKSRGYGFITYKHMESTQKALQEPSKYGEIKKVQLPMIKRLTNQGRNITVKLADSPKSKIIQSQVPAAMVPITIPVPVGYAQTGKTQIGSSATVGYASYPPAMAAYPAAYPNAQIQYPTAPQVSYPQTGKRESVGLPAVASPGITGFPYYVTKP